MTNTQMRRILAHWGFEFIVEPKANGTFDIRYHPSFIKKSKNYLTLNKGLEATYNELREVVYGAAISLGVDLYGKPR